MLKNDEVVILQELLLARDVDVKVWIRLVQIMKGDARELAGHCRERTIDPRFLNRGVGEEHKDASGCRHSDRMLGDRRIGKSRAGGSRSPELLRL